MRKIHIIMGEKKSIFHKLSDISRIHQRAAFTDVAKHTAPKESAFLRLAAERYSCRSFTGADISDDELASLLEAARLAPSAINNQPVHLWVFKSPEARERLKEVTKYTFDAPVIILVACKEDQAWVRGCDGKNSAEVDAAIAGTHIMMEAVSLGLGSTWVGSFNPARLAQLFPETAEWTPVALFPIGHPAGEPSPRHSHRKSIKDFTSQL